MSPVAGLFGALVAANIAAWSWAWMAFHDRPVLLGTAFLAWSLGLRHAVDADHIAAIDNVTRKLVQEGRRSPSVGLFFALGHSAVVALAVAALALAAPSLRSWMEGWREIGGLIGTLVSALFLFAIAAVNLVIFRSTWQAFRRAQDGGRVVDLPAGGGLLTRLCRPLFALITRPWHMMLLGFLFGLGFDTATEVALLGLSATQAANGLSLWAVLVFPALFAAAIPQMAALNVMALSSPRNAVLAALVFNAIVIPALIPLALKGVRFKPASAVVLLRRNMLVYGVGGVLLPFAGIKLIDMALVAMGI